MDYNDKPKEESGGSGIKLPKPSIDIGGVKVEPAKLPLGAYGVRFTKQFKAKGGMVGYRKSADGCAKRGKTRGKMS